MFSPAMPAGVTRSIEGSEHLMRRAIFAMIPLMASAAPVAAQTETSVTLVGGAVQYDLSGTGTTPFIAARVEVVPASARFVVAEAGLEFVSYEPQFGERRHHWIPEAMVQLQVPAESFRPYLGVGIGYSYASTDSAPTLAVAGGTRLRLTADWGLRAELRVRSIDPWTGSTADWGFGISRRF